MCSLLCARRAPRAPAALPPLPRPHVGLGLCGASPPLAPVLVPAPTCPGSLRLQLASAPIPSHHTTHEPVPAADQWRAVARLPAGPAAWRRIQPQPPRKPRLGPAAERRRQGHRPPPLLRPCAQGAGLRGAVERAGRGCVVPTAACPQVLCPASHLALPPVHRVQDVNDEMVRQHFSKWGTVNDVYFPR